MRLLCLVFLILQVLVEVSGGKASPGTQNQLKHSTVSINDRDLDVVQHVSPGFPAVLFSDYPSDAPSDVPSDAPSSVPSLSSSDFPSMLPSSVVALDIGVGGTEEVESSRTTSCKTFGILGLALLNMWFV